MKEKWIDPSKKLPTPFDLVCLKTDRGSFNGWWTGHKWCALRKKSSDRINGWYRCYTKNE